MPENALFTPPLENDEHWKASIQEYYVWLRGRMVGSHREQPVPALGGFISARLHMRNFKVKEKVCPLKKLQKFPKFQDAFRQMGVGCKLRQGCV